MKFCIRKTETPPRRVVIVEANRDLDEEEEQRKEGLLHTSAGVLGASASAAGPASCDPRAAHHRWTDDGRSRLRLWLLGRDAETSTLPIPRRVAIATREECDGQSD